MSDEGELCATKSVTQEINGERFFVGFDGEAKGLARKKAAINSLLVHVGFTLSQEQVVSVCLCKVEPYRNNESETNASSTPREK